MRTKRAAAQVMLPQPSPIETAASDHFAGLEEGLVARGITVDRLIPGQRLARLSDQTKVILVPNTESGDCRYLIREAKRVRAMSVLLMDGIVEWRNTFINARSGTGFLRPAPVDLVLCAGSIDQRVLTAMGNRAIATGLPRIGRFAATCEKHAPSCRENRRTILVATAKTPVFDEAERVRLVNSLTDVRDAATAMRVNILWRLGGGIEQHLVVPNDLRPLADVISECDAALCTASTLLVECMIAGGGLPTGLIHPHPTPLWQPANWIYGGTDTEAHRRDAARLNWEQRTQLDSSSCAALREIAEESSWRSQPVNTAHELLERVLSASPEDMTRQRSILNDLHTAPSDAIERICDAVCGCIEQPVPAPRAGVFRDDPARGAIRTFPPPHRPRVLITAKCDTIADSSADASGGTSFRRAQAIAHAFAKQSANYDVRVLGFAWGIDAWRIAGRSLPEDNLTRVCVLDPYEDSVSTLQRARTAMESCKPDLIVAADRDFCFAAATLVRDATRNSRDAVTEHAEAGSPKGIRVIAMVGEDTSHDRSLAEHYDSWDGAIIAHSASADCMTSRAALRDAPVISLGDQPETANAPALRAAANVQSLTALFDQVRLGKSLANSAWSGITLLEPCHDLAPTPVRPEEAIEWVRANLSGASSTSNAVVRVIPDNASLEILESAQALEPKPSNSHHTTAQSPLRTVVFAPSLRFGFDELRRRAATIREETLIHHRLTEITSAGYRRLVVYGLGKLLHRHSGIFDRDYPIVGIMDDHPMYERIYRVPVVASCDVVNRLNPDAVILFSNAWEHVMWTKTEPLRRAGVCVVPLFRAFTDNPHASDTIADTPAIHHEQSLSTNKRLTTHKVTPAC